MGRLAFELYSFPSWKENFLLHEITLLLALLGKVFDFLDLFELCR